MFRPALEPDVNRPIKLPLLAVLAEDARPVHPRSLMPRLSWVRTHRPSPDTPSEPEPEPQAEATA